MKRVAVLVSGGGTNLQALLDAKHRGEIPHGDIALVMASKPGIRALARAEAAGVAATVCRRADFADADAFDEAVCRTLLGAAIDVVVLAGYLQIVGPKTLAAFGGSIINIHPSLIPSFCGDGYYGLKVHQAALARGVQVTGATVHLVNEVVDGGRILLQKAVEVQPGDTPETLQRRVMEQAEWVILPRALEMVCQGECEPPCNSPR